jgi:hypothetical protein
MMVFSIFFMSSWRFWTSVKTARAWPERCCCMSYIHNYKQNLSYWCHMHNVHHSEIPLTDCAKMGDCSSASIISSISSWVAFGLTECIEIELAPCQSADFGQRTRKLTNLNLTLHSLTVLLLVCTLNILVTQNWIHKVLLELCNLRSTNVGVRVAGKIGVRRFESCMRIVGEEKVR